MAATWDSQYLVRTFARLTGMAPNGAPTPETRFERLSEAQNEIVGNIAGRFPRVLYPVTGYSTIPTLTTTDQQLFTFGTDDNGYALSPMGASIYPSLDSIPDNPWRRGRDYVPVGATGIRIPNNNTYAGTLYWVGVSPPADITQDDQPALFPEASRELIVLLASARYLEEYGRNLVVSDRLWARYNQRWPEWALVWRTQFKDGGVLGGITGLGLGITGTYRNATLI